MIILPFLSNSIADPEQLSYTTNITKDNITSPEDLGPPVTVSFVVSAIAMLFNSTYQCVYVCVYTIHTVHVYMYTVVWFFSFIILYLQNLVLKKSLFIYFF